MDQKNMEIVIASNNVHKIDEIRDKLRPLLDITVHAMKDRCGSMDIEETGKTFEDNALIKARAVHDFCKMAVLADDSGLVVDFLKGEPGVYSARYGGLSSDQERNMLLLSKLEGVPTADRTARFVCVMALCREDGTETVVRGECEGIIAEAPSGSCGFGYDPIFYIPEFECTMAQLSMEQKNRISHRARALDSLHHMLKSLI